MAVNEFTVKLKTKDNNLVLKNGVDPKTSLNRLGSLISEVTAIPMNNIKVLFGYPRKPLDLTSSSYISEVGIKNGETLFVEEGKSTNDFNSQQSAKSIDDVTHDKEPKHHIADPMPKETKGIFMKKEVPSDNSCLFTSLGFVLSGKVDTSLSSLMRQSVAAKIASEPEEYNDAILGKPNKEYCTWIMNPNSWGGAIELAVLSDYYGFEIAVVNSVTGVISRFGEDKRYDQRVFLLFDGIHYDPLYKDFMETNNMQTIFSTSDDEVLHEVQQLAYEAKESKQFTDVNQFVIRCVICNANLVGQLEAQKHAEQTGHTKFDEVKS